MDNQSLFARFVRRVKRRKVATVLIVLVVAGGLYYAYGVLKGGNIEPRYVLAAAESGTLVVSVSGTGQVSVEDQINIKAKASGDVTAIPVANGQSVSAGTILVQLDSRDAEKAVRDAEVNLESARIALEKLAGPEGAAISRAKENAEADLAQSYEDGFNTVANAYLDLPALIAGLQSILYSKSFDPSIENVYYYSNSVETYDASVVKYRNDVIAAYHVARTSYDKNFAAYKATSRFSTNEEIEALIGETYDTTKNIAEAAKSATNLIQFYKDKLIERNLQPSSVADAHLSSLATYTDKTNSHLTSLLSAQNAIKDNKDAVVNADLDVRSQALTVKQRENALFDAKEKLDDYFIRAPFDGVVAKVDVKRGEPISTGAVVATFIARQPVAEISLNEVDVAQVKVGQRATLTFDAVPGLTIVGEVNEIDTVGTISAGVVSYIVKVNFTTRDDRVKPGMTVTADIVTESKHDVLLVPNSAVKAQSGSSYVEVANVDIPENRTNGREMVGTTLQTPPRRVPVEVGFSNDEFTEILSGLKAGERVVVVTLHGNAPAPAARRQNAGFRLPIPGGGGVRAR